MDSVNTKQVAHIVAQVRAKQLATKSIQDNMSQIIVQYHEDHPDVSDRELAQQFLQNISTDHSTSVSINNYLNGQDINLIGYPIKFNKTHLQLNMAKEWIAEQKESLITQIIAGKFYHKLSNEIRSAELPVLQSPSTTQFWGNENPSVSSILLADIVASCNKKQDNLSGAATCFPFFSSNYELPDSFVSASYSFASKNGMTLFGDYQYGGQRYFDKQFVFGPEDCSTAVGKATYLRTDQIKSIETSSMQAAYFNRDNQYHYQGVTFLSGDIQDNQLKLIQEGDIYLIKGHTAIIATKPDNRSKITTIQFSRDIDSAENNTLGGGTYDYSLCDVARKIKSGIYILRSTDLEPLHESCSLSQLLSRIDSKYATLFSKGPLNIAGDCRMFLEDNAISTAGEFHSGSSL
ncbi:uncharacterized protein LOC116347432 [Contarinia nasturtii]|uniref:uncharacterized protein LOC116347432 n=1 Tax=Contarinia nasturtii TaxID=265458 RepID=UPI0012D45607|nr:uncharacterized protein LOC116347432 [Contarinia nasturtii]